MSSNGTDEYTAEEKKELLQLARQTIERFLKSGTKVYPETENPKFRENRGVFVSLHLRGELRGCIGYPLPSKPLIEAVVDNSVSSAVEDPRFNAVQPSELKDIDIEISILTVPSEVESVENIVVGRDGIIISKGFMRGLLLPQVPESQGWDREQYISHGCMKAGLPMDEWKRGVKIETFQGIVFSEND
jgi:AmmeMemoRadiSam system protein A